MFEAALAAGIGEHGLDAPAPPGRFGQFLLLTRNKSRALYRHDGVTLH